MIVGHPASAGRATGPVRIVHSPQDFGEFRDGDVLVAKATAPAWTPLFARAAAIVTDGGTLAAHASLVAREYAIPAVVATGNATLRLHSGQLVTVDGSAGTITPHDEHITDQREGPAGGFTADDRNGNVDRGTPPTGHFKINTLGVLSRSLSEPGVHRRP